MTERADTYLIISNGYYWRPQSSGYTRFVGEAGIYSLDEVSQIISPLVSGVSHVHLEDATDILELGK